MNDEAEIDPVEAELIAYLDGELDGADARRVEDRLARDGKLRARAESLKRSFDLLEFLPKPEPSATFATRTMDRLPISQATGRSAPEAATASSSVPTALPSGASSPALADVLPTPVARPWRWGMGIAAGVAIAVAAGYFGTAAVHSRPATEPLQHSLDLLSTADLPIIEKLPLYGIVDDFDFLKRLAAPEFFTAEAAAASDGANPAVPLEKPSDAQMEELIRVFRQLPSEKQERIRELDRRINAEERSARDRWYRLLEVYSAWLHRLPDADRKEILAAASADKRLEAIREVQRKQWIAYLPAARRKEFDEVTAEVKAQLITQWKEEEDKNRQRWSMVRMQWEAARTGKQPWPFMDESMRKEVMDYVVAVYHPNDAKRSRLSMAGADGGDASRLKEAIERAGKGEWVLLGKAVYDFSRKYEMLPEPANGSPIVEINDLSPWPLALKHYANRANARRKIEASRGKWPEFALAVHGDLRFAKLSARAPSHQLGPCRPIEFKAELRKFLPALKKKCSAAEWSNLRSLEGKWPEYPRELVFLAKAHDLSVPGVMPPGLPSRWVKTYSLGRRPMPRPGG